MDWNLKNPLQWDWESFAPFSGKETEIAKPSQQSEWKVRDGGNVNKSVHSSGRAFSSGSEMGNGSSKSSISASADSSSKAGNKIEFNFETVKGFGKNLNKNERSAELEYAGALSSSREPLIGLKLGKRTYFEDVCGGNNVKNLPSSASGAPSTALVKRTKASHQSMQSSFCQVEGCNIDLTLAKDYHRKHRVCETHSKSSKVIVAGQERRFCQQCSRFHDLSEFDLKKRSCRRRLSDHNARRRKPQPETISFSSSRISTSIYDDRQQMNLLFSRVPFGQVRSNVSSLWEDSGGFKITQMEGSWGKSTKAGGVEGQPHFPNPDLSNNVTTLRHDLDRLLPFKGTTAEVLNQGLEASAIASNLNGAPDLRRALSLLSTDSCGPADLGSTSQLQFANANQNTAAYPAMHVNSTSGFWHDQQPLAQQARVLAFDHHGNSNQFQEFQLLKTSYENSFFDSTQIH